MLDKRILNLLVIILLTFITFTWTFFIYHIPFDFVIPLSVIVVRILASFLILKDYSLSWSKSTQKTFLIKSVVYFSAFMVYMPFLYGYVRFSFLMTEVLVYLFSINLIMYAYYYYINKSRVIKTKSAVIYGAGKAGIKLEMEFKNTEYKVKYFCDDESVLQGRSIDNVKILSKEKLNKITKDVKFDLLLIAMPSAPKSKFAELYEELNDSFKSIKILPSFEDILQDKDYSKQLKEISVEDLLARSPADLDKEKISSFIKDKSVLVTGAGGSIGSEIVRQCVKYGASKLILLDHSEFNLYSIEQEVGSENVFPVMQSVLNIEDLKRTFSTYKPDLVIHAAAYKHVPLVEANIREAIKNNVLGTKNITDCAIESGVDKLVLISTDKAVRPTNVMGTTKRICELYAQNSNGQGTDIVAVRFGNVLGSSGSVIPKFKAQIAAGKNITVTHPDITRYFMLIPEACELVLQAGAIGTGGEIFILDMGEPIKIVDLANKMIELSGREDIEIEFSGLRTGEKLYEELLIDDTDCSTEYESITVAKPTPYELKKLSADIKELLTAPDQLSKLKEIVPEFDHQLNN
ncbi:MAG TPA: polysaccharide biosynthesis protein [Sulfurimonas sp.]|nr:polysaccharide biosynthesis protein [Sulfurimonas sp.]HIM76163.1 polysaccharide biosynthesis protein [Campylobacterales bacterium]